MTSAPGGLGEVARLFLKLGVIGFGGPAAHIALMREEVVRRRRWLCDERFLDLVGMASLIPGPTSTELSIYLGYVRAGWPGLLVGGICFIGPAVVIVLALAWLYVRYGTTPAVTSVQDVRIDHAARRAWRGDVELELSAKEFDLLALLAADAGRAVTRDRIMREVWDEHWYGPTKTLDMHISWLRKKLGDDAANPRFISTVRGVGFRFERG